MKKLLIYIFLLCSLSAFAQNNIKKTAGINYTQGAPTFTPDERTASEIAIDTVTGFVYQWHRTAGPSNFGGWRVLGQGIDVRVDAVPPNYVPFRNQSVFVVNAVDSLYYYHGGSWHHLNKSGGGGGGTYTAGTGIAINGSNVISNTGDLSTTNELNTSLSVTGGNLRLTDAGGNKDVAVTDIAPIQGLTAGTGISISGTSNKTITATGGADGNGIYSGSGNVPNGTVSTLNGSFDINANYAGFTSKFSKYASGYGDYGNFLGFYQSDDALFGSAQDNAIDGEFTVIGRYANADYENTTIFNQFGLTLQSVNNLTTKRAFLQAATGDFQLFSQDPTLGGDATISMSGNNITISGSPGASDFLGLVYGSDLSVPISANDRSIPDVGTIKSGLIPVVIRQVDNATSLNGEIFYSTDGLQPSYKDAGGIVSTIISKSGSTTATTSAAGEITITHGIGAAPSVVTATYIGNNAYFCTITNKGATTFKVKVWDAAGAAVASTSVTVDWISR